MDRTRVDLAGLQATVDRAARFAAELIRARAEGKDTIPFRGAVFEYRASGSEEVRITEDGAVVLKAYRPLRGNGLWKLEEQVKDLRLLRQHLVEWIQRFNTEAFKAEHVHLKKNEKSRETAPA